MDEPESEDFFSADESETVEEIFGDFLPTFGLACVVAAVVVTVTLVVLIGAARTWWAH